ncbi:MAG: hypothetical protein B6D63_03770 [Candidatus Latescibacteria bacterium 4484_7]|nr:MAG: hypothetical protein B6D63_03770 [Candidatus Latescibacteria bacterium 4484_7]
MGSDFRERRKIRVLVGEDSPLMRRIIVDALSEEEDIEVVGAVPDGREVLKKAVGLKPDCITLDLEMPHMDGIETLRYLMGEWPTPVVIVSAHSNKGAETTIKCLEYGAVDFVPKGKAGTSFPVAELIRKVHVAATVDAKKLRYFPPDRSLVTKKRQVKETFLKKLVIIGASTGGPNALAEIMQRLDPSIPAGVLIAQHMPPNFTRYLAERLDDRSRFDIAEAVQENVIEAGKALVAPGGMHIFVEERIGTPIVVLLPKNETTRSSSPSIDFAFSSAARVLGNRVIGVVLTGMGTDGLAGSIAIKRAGGVVISQDESTSVVYGMPGAVAREGVSDAIVPIGRIADEIEKLVVEPATVESVDEH